VIAHVKDGKLVKLEGDPEHPWSQGRLCARALAMTQYVHHPDRLRTPLKRAGERGEGKWEEISWEEAYDLIEARMKAIRDEHGPESFLFTIGTGRDIYPWISLLAYTYGSPNIVFGLSGNSCYATRISACKMVQGDYMVFDAAQWFPDRYDDPRWKQPECLVIWGYNIPASCPDNLFGHWIVDLMKRGTKIITIDPRLSWFASRSEHWLQLRPGTDAAIAMGFLNVIVNEGLYDRDFVARWTNAAHLVRTDTGRILRESELSPGGAKGNFVAWDGARNEPAVWNVERQAYPEGARPLLEGRFDVTLADGATVACETVWTGFRREVDRYPAERVAEITMVPAEQVREAARFYAQAKPAAIHWGVPIDMTPNMTPTAHAMAALWCITGNLDVPGGNVLARFAFNAVAYALPGTKSVFAPSAEAEAKRIATDRYGIFKKFSLRAQTDVTLEQIFSGEPYPIKGMWMAASNLIGGLGQDPKRWVEALKKLDFVVAVDLFHTPSTQLADVVLPAASFLEKDGVRSWWVPLQTINQAMTVEGCKPDIEIGFELARRFDPEFQWETVHDLLDDILKPSGMTFAELQAKGWAFPPEGHPSAPYRRHEKGLLRPDGTPGFCTPSGRVELYSTLREEWGLEPFPLFEEPPLSPLSRPDLAKDYPLILSTGRRSPVLYHTEHRQIPWLRALDPDPVVEIHPHTAAEHGVGHGEWVWVENSFGKALFKAKVTLEVPTWMVMAAHGWWFPEREGAEPSLHGAFRSNANNLIPMGYQGKDGQGAPIKHGLCKVYKATPEEIAHA
jgi:anaerobic selenocysteine-containing dehydrogenase